MDDMVSKGGPIRVFEKLLSSDPRRGYSERREHLDLIRSGGYTAFGVVCTRDGPGGPIRDFTSGAVLRLGDLDEDREFVHATVVGAESVARLK